MKVIAKSSYGDPDDYDKDLTHYQEIVVVYGDEYPCLAISFEDRDGVPVVEIKSNGTSPRLDTQLIVEPQVTNVVRVYPRKREDR